MSDNVQSNKFQSIDFDKLKLNLKHIKFTKLKLIYRGEGNDNLVLNIPDIKYILRFHKGYKTFNVEDENEKLKTSFLYHYIFMKYIFTSAYSLVPVIVEISNSEVEELEKLFYEQRPEHRQKKSVLHNVVEVYPDCAFLPVFNAFTITEKNFMEEVPGTNYLKQLLSNQYITYRNFVSSLLMNATNDEILISKYNDINVHTMCVEIKPKQAWAGATDLNYGICSFCLNQYFKLDTNKISSRSKYCPMDLFSGNPERMKYALKQLLKTPQNNLRIFKDGQLAFDEKCMKNLNNVLSNWFNDENIDKCVENFCDLIIKILTYEFIYKNEEIIPLICEVDAKNIEKKVNYLDINIETLEEIMNISEKKCRKENINLPDRSVLGRIYTLQKVDGVGVEHALHFYEKHINEFNSEFGYIYNLITRVQFKEKIVLPTLNVVEAYLLSAAAKDLSILIALKSRPIFNEKDTLSKLILCDTNKNKYEVKISLVDVGPKPVSCMQKHWKRNKNIINSYLKYCYPNFSE